VVPPPPPPPLPPVTFAVTLPTSITFSRPATANLPNSFLPLQVSLLSTSNHGSDSKPSILSTSTLTRPPNAHLINNEALSKEAQDILKISEDLSNFGRAHALNENQNRLLSSARLQTPLHEDDEDGNALAMLLGEVEKDLHLVDDMDVVLDDQSSQDFPISSDNSSNRDFMHSGGLGENNSGNTVSMDSSSNDRHNHSSNLHHMMNGKHSNASDDLLDELGQLLPSDLDVPMPMEMDYSDWLDNLLPENNNSSSDSVNMNSNSISEVNSMTTTPGSMSDSSGTNNNNNFYGVMMDFNSDQFGQRDPLLSSRSLNIFSSSSIPENSTTSTLTTTSLDLKPINRAPSPMSMDSGLLWDFV
jgi:hypothetical protein